MGDRVQSRGRARMAGDKDQIPLLRAAIAPLKVMRGSSRRAVLVRTEERNVEGIPREFEVIGIAAEEGDRGFRSKHQANIRVFLVAVKVIAAAAIERDHVAAQASPIKRLFFDPRRGLPACLGGSGVVGPLWHPLVHKLGYVIDGDQNVQLQVRAFTSSPWVRAKKLSLR